MEHQNWGILQLGLFALAFGGLQVWWISSTLRRRERTRPMSEGEFRRSLERIWAPLRSSQRKQKEYYESLAKKVITD